MANQYINLMIEDKVAKVTINNPPANALSSPVMKELQETFKELADNNDVKVIIVTGAGNFFVAGADIKEIAAISSAERGEELTAAGQGILNIIEGMEKPVIAAINGFCLGGGLELSMACHIRIAGDRVRFGQPEINLGIIPGFGGTQRLARLVGRAKAIELILTGDVISAQDAKAIGLVNKIVPGGDVIKHANGLAKKIASKGGIALRSALKAIKEGYYLSLEDGLKLESRLFGKVCETEDMKEGLNAFIEKRQPRFQDR
ncbi:MAG: enoyl-CoA hydratase [Nitrospirota bacterium]